MTLARFYESLGGSLPAVLARIPSEAMVRKFARMYAGDTSCDELEAAVKAKDWQTAFLAAHTLKGVAQNLGFAQLARDADALTEHLRGASPLTQPELLEAVRTAHAHVLFALEELDA